MVVAQYYHHHHHYHHHYYITTIIITIIIITTTTITIITITTSEIVGLGALLLLDGAGFGSFLAASRARWSGRSVWVFLARSLFRCENPRL